MGAAYLYSSRWAIALFFGLPLAGLLVYIRLHRRMRQAGYNDAFLVLVFGLFACYGTLLEFLITTLGRIPWSGMHSLGLFSLVFGASWLLPLLGYLAVREPGRSAYHHRARQLSFLFPVALGAALGAMLLLAPAYP